MKKTEKNRFNKLYKRHLRLLKLQGKSQKTIAAYARAVRRISEYFDCCPDKLTLKQREKYFSKLVERRSWSTVKVDRVGLQFFWKHVLKLDWEWLNIIKPPKIHTIPDILTPTEIEKLHAYPDVAHTVISPKVHVQDGPMYPCIGARKSVALSWRQFLGHYRRPLMARIAD